MAECKKSVYGKMQKSVYGKMQKSRGTSGWKRSIMQMDPCYEV